MEAVILQLIKAENPELCRSIMRNFLTQSRFKITSPYAQLIYARGTSTLTISSGARLLLRKGSELLVKANTSLIIESGAEVTLYDEARIVVEPGGTLYLKGNEIRLLGKDAVIIMKGTLKTEENVDFTFTGDGYASFYDTHDLDLGVGSKFVIQRSSGDNRFLELRENTTLHIENRSIDLLNGTVHYWDDSKIVAEGQYVKFKGITATSIESSRTSTAIAGFNNTLFEVENCKFFDLLTGARYTGPTTIPIFEGNIVKFCTEGFRVESVNAAFFTDNDLQYLFETGVYISEISRAIFTNNFISGNNLGLVGIEMIGIRNAVLNNTAVRRFEEYGVRANNSNVTLQNGANIRYNDVGVLYHGNTTANWFLAVGKCGCASIANNTVGITGDNIILEIDAEENQVSCNSASLQNNNFNDNTIVFDICYTDPNYIPPNTILMKGNYWGGGPLSNYQYSIAKSSCQLEVNVDDSNFINTSCYGNNGGGGTIGTTENFGPQEENKVQYSFYDKGKVVEVHDIYRMAHTGYYNETFLEIPTSVETYSNYKSISELNKTTHNDNKAVYKIDVSRCMINAFDNNTIGNVAGLNSSEEDSVTEQQKLAQFEIYPNPATDRIWINSKSDEAYQISVYNMMGQRVDQRQFSGKMDLTVANWSKGIYLIEIRNEAGGFIKTEKMVVQ